jgi:ubiquinone/menaquinone biosynthesis C-methylase UbiE
MSLAAMVLADRSERAVRFYDRWIGLITFGRDTRVRNMVLAEVRSGDRMLDVGCGTGTLAVAAAAKGATVAAIDRSPAMLAIARQKAAAAGVTVDWRAGEVSSPSVDGQSFDLVTATFVLSELSRDLAELAVRRLAEALRPGGRLIVADEAPPTQPLVRVLAAIPRAILWLLSFVALQQLAPTRRHPWRALLEEAGLQVTAVRSFQAGGLVVLVARRPLELPHLRRPLLPLQDALPSGPRRLVLRVAAWFDLPIAIRPGIYTLGEPSSEAPVLLTGNFLASAEAVRQGMAGSDAFVVVEDTDGWNVWCAADAGLFNGAKAAALLELHGLAEIVSQRRIVVPRLGGRVRPGLAALSGWEAAIGPIEARDLPRFLASGISPEMHSLDRLYRLQERVRVGALTLVQLPLFLFPLRWLPRSLGRPAWRFALAASCLLPLAHYHLPGRTGVVKGTCLGLGAAIAGTATRRLSLRGVLGLLSIAPLVGWIYQSSSPVIFWKRLWR